MSATRRQRLLHGGSHTALDVHLIGWLNSELQLLSEDVARGGRNPTDECLARLYAYAPEHCAESTLLQRVLPKPWQVTDGYYFAVVEPLEAMVVMPIERLPEQHQMTARCFNADAHTTVLAQHEWTFATAHPDWPYSQVKKVAARAASDEWAASLRTGRVAPCTRHSTRPEQFATAARIACRTVEACDEPARQQAVQHHADAAVRELVFQLFQNPIIIERDGTLGDGQSRVCAARQYGVPALPVLLAP